MYYKDFRHARDSNMHVQKYAEANQTKHKQQMRVFCTDCTCYT